MHIMMRPLQGSGSGRVLRAALLSFFLTSVSGFGQDPVSITSIEVDSAQNCFRICLVGVAGEFVVEATEDFQSWGSLCRLGSDGSPVEFCDPMTSRFKAYRVAAIPESDGFHLNGVNVQELESTVVYGDLATVFGFPFGAAPAIPSVLALPSAERDTRIYSATIATLSVLTQSLRDTIEPPPSVADIVAALATDLASGNLDGRDTGGARVEIGTSGVFLPEYTDQDLADALSQLKGELNGLGNVFLQATGGGQFAPSVPAEWGLFYWDSADWQ